MIVWYAHYRYFRRYGTEDAGTLWLNGILLFFVLFYVYPLKFLFRMAFSSDGALVSPHDARELTILYALGMAAIYTLIAALYANAWRQRDELELTPLERKLTILTMWDEGLVAVIALLAVLLACVLPSGHATMATMTFMLIGVSKTITDASWAAPHATCITTRKAHTRYSRRPPQPHAETDKSYPTTHTRYTGSPWHQKNCK